jgi:hypothetical protein
VPGRACIVLLLLIGFGYPAGRAQAADTAKLTVRFSPNRLGAETTVLTDIKFGTTDGGVPSPVTAFELRLPLQLNPLSSTLGLAVCNPANLLEGGLTGCSPNARLGFGSATVEVPFGPEAVAESARVTPLLGPPSKDEQLTILLFAESVSPVFAQLVFPGELIPGSGKFVQDLNTAIPVTPTLPGAPDASVVDMHLSVGAENLTYYKQVHGKTVGFRPRGPEVPTRCPRGGFVFVAVIGFQDGSRLTEPSPVPCPKVTRKRR